MKIHEVEQRSEAWYRLRAGMPTASEFSRIVQSDGTPSASLSGYALTLAVELFAGKPCDAWEGNAWTERGREVESAALSLYAFTTDQDVIPVGFVTDEAETMGCSPDGLIGDAGLVEVKCLKAENHAKTIIYHRKHGKCPPEYVQQSQGQMLVCGRKWCDLVFYHPELPPLTIRQTPDEAVWKGLALSIPKLLADRDEVFAALREQAGTARKAA